MIPLLRPKKPNFGAAERALADLNQPGEYANGGVVSAYVQSFVGGLLTSSGTAALFLAVKALRVKTVALPEYTHEGTIRAVQLAGCRAVVMPVSPLNPILEAHDIPDGVDAAIVVAPFGWHINFDSYRDLDIPVIFDLAGAYPQRPQEPEDNWQWCYSFHATKRIHCGEGGAVCSPNADYMHRHLILRSFGYGGGNFKMSEINAAFLIGQVDREIPNDRAQTLMHYFDKIPTASVPLTALNPSSISLCVLKLDKSLPEKLAKFGIQSKQYFPGLLSNGKFDDWIALPSDVNSEERGHVVECVKECLNLK